MLRGKTILITSGPTRAPLDAVRILTNISTGFFGTLLAQEALRKGARVVFVYGKGSLTPPPHRRLKCISVETNDDVENVLHTHLKKKRCSAVIHAMAVLDFQPQQIARGKIKTKRGAWILKLIPTPKIINAIKKWGPKILLVGFKLEVGVTQKKLFQSARGLLKTSKADFVLANRLTEGGDGKHKGFLLNKAGRIIAQGTGKKHLAKLILDTLDKI